MAIELQSPVAPTLRPVDPDAVEALARQSPLATIARLDAATAHRPDARLVLLDETTRKSGLVMAQTIRRWSLTPQSGITLLFPLLTRRETRKRWV